MLNFNLATSERKRGADDTWSDGPTSWFRVSAWNDLARNAHASFHKGQLVIVRGVLTIREFQAEGGGRSRQAELRATRARARPALGHQHLRRRGPEDRDAGARTRRRAPAPEPESGGWGATPGQPSSSARPSPPGRRPDWASGLGTEDVPF